MSAKKEKPSKEELENLYFIEKKTQKEIAIIWRTSTTTVKNWRKSYDIPTIIIEPISKEELFDLYITQNKSQEEIAELLGKGRDYVISWVKRYNIKKDKEQINAIRSATNLKIYGTKYAIQNKEVKEKGKASTLKIYGAENFSQTTDFLIKIRKYNQLKSDKIATKEQLFDLYITRNMSQREIAKLLNVHLSWVFRRIKKYNMRKSIDKIHQTIQENSFKFKSYITPQGKNLQIRGFEYLALDILFTTRTDKEIIVGSDVPVIEWYDFKNKKHSHFPDIFLPLENKIIEVKSTFTAHKADNSWKILFKKENAEQMGFNYEIWIFNNRKKLVEII